MFFPLLSDTVSLSQQDFQLPNLVRLKGSAPCSTALVFLVRFTLYVSASLRFAL